MRAIKPLAILALPLILSAMLSACGGSSSQSRPAADANETEHPYGLVSSDPAVQYFHDQLSASGDDLSGDFGTYLSMLDMNPRDLQQDDPKHAHDVVLDKVRTVQDASLRSKMMQAFFNGQ